MNYDNLIGVLISGAFVRCETKEERLTILRICSNHFDFTTGVKSVMNGEADDSMYYRYIGINECGNLTCFSRAAVNKGNMPVFNYSDIHEDYEYNVPDAACFSDAIAALLKLE